MVGSKDKPYRNLERKKYYDKHRVESLPAGKRRKWSDREEAKLIKLDNEGHIDTYIVKALKRNMLGIQIKRHRLKKEGAHSLDNKTVLFNASKRKRMTLALKQWIDNLDVEAIEDKMPMIATKIKLKTCLKDLWEHQAKNGNDKAPYEERAKFIQGKIDVLEHKLGENNG